MHRVRRVDADAFDANGRSAQFLFQGESCVIVARSIPASPSGPTGQFAAPCDQVWYVLEGALHLDVGAEHHVVGADTLVLIPAGMPHRTWNDDKSAAVYLEILAPAPRPDLPLATPVDGIAESTGDVRATIVPVNPQNMFDIPPLPGFRMNHLLPPGGLSEHAAAYVGEVDAASFGPPTHIHAFDQFYFVLQGAMTVALALDRHRAGPWTLVAIPAGVPHTQWNEGSVMERHLAINCPAPPAGVRPDIGVTFALKS
jgi:mannose-6-phosphate isomerase-like protein (cupin superfamily)